MRASLAQERYLSSEYFKSQNNSEHESALMKMQSRGLNSTKRVSKFEIKELTAPSAHNIPTVKHETIARRKL